MRVDDSMPDPGSSGEVPIPSPSVVDAGPLGPLPRVALHQVRFEARLARLNSGAGIGPAIGWLVRRLGTAIEVRRPEVTWRASGLRRAGLTAQFTWPRLATRFAVGLETPIAHAVVDRLLGFDRLPVEGRLPLSPVEWGILTYAVSETARRLEAEGHGPFGVWDPTIDRVSPDPFDGAGLGRLVTVRWPITIGSVEASIRLWLSESLAVRWLSAQPVSLTIGDRAAQRFGDLASTWRAEAGTIALPRGLKTLRAGGVLPLVHTRLAGTPKNPGGDVELVLKLSGHDGRLVYAAQPVPNSGGGRLTLNTYARHVPTPREAIAMNPSSSPAPASPDPAAPDVPVTLVVELGRVNMPLGRLADLKPGDVVELGRHSREPVELTSGGRLVARGELVLIDTELGVRVTHLLL